MFMKPEKSKIKTKWPNYFSNIDWELMKVCWDQRKTTVKDVHEETLRVNKRNYQSTKTMMDRLAVKGFLKKERFGPIWIYKPTLSRVDATNKAIDNFINIVLDGSYDAIFEHFLKSTDKDSKEYKDLKKMFLNFETKNGRTTT